jgi:hypothetical protein
MLEGFDEEARKYLEAGTGGLHTKERCQEAKAKLARKNDYVMELAQKNDHGNEELEGTISNLKIIKEIEERRQQAIGNEFGTASRYVDHTAKGVPRFIAFESISAADLTEQGNEWIDKQGDKVQIKLIGQLQATKDGFAIALYYEEIKQ